VSGNICMPAFSALIALIALIALAVGVDACEGEGDDEDHVLRDFFVTLQLRQRGFYGFYPTRPSNGLCNAFSGQQRRLSRIYCTPYMEFITAVRTRKQSDGNARLCAPYQTCP
jgi:hypothetical protein